MSSVCVQLICQKSQFIVKNENKVLMRLTLCHRSCLAILKNVVHTLVADFVVVVSLFHFHFGPTLNMRASRYPP